MYRDLFNQKLPLLQHREELLPAEAFMRRRALSFF